MKITPAENKQLRTIAPAAFRVEEAAQALAVGRTLVYQLIKEGRLKAIHIGRRTLIPVKEVEDFVARLGSVA